MAKKIEYIRRDEAIRYAQWEGDYKVVMRLEEMKAADVQPVKHGKWLHFNNDSNFIFCSECKHEAYWDTDYGQQLFDYCPYCGARMMKDGDTE